MNQKDELIIQKYLNMQEQCRIRQKKYYDKHKETILNDRKIKDAKRAVKNALIDSVIDCGRELIGIRDGDEDEAAKVILCHNLLHYLIMHFLLISLHLLFSFSEFLNTSYQFRAFLTDLILLQIYRLCINL